MLICLVVFIGCNRQKSDETITNPKKYPLIFSVNLPETMRSADSFRIDFVNVEDMNEDDTPNFTGQIRIDDAIEGANAVIPGYLSPLDLFLDKVENANG